MTTGLIIAVVVLLIWSIVLTIRVKKGVVELEKQFKDVYSSVNHKIAEHELYILNIKDDVNTIQDYYTNEFKKECLELAIKMYAGSNKDVITIALNIEDYLLHKEEKKPKKSVPINKPTK